MRILSLGAGVQSSTIALMIVHGEIDPVSCGIFADTQCEPSYVYRWLDYLESILTFPIHRVSAGNLGRDFLRHLSVGNGRVASIPLTVLGPQDKGEGGRLWRQCTTDYKVVVIRREMRKFMEECGEKSVDQLIGISTDEAHRMRHSQVGYITNVYPLIDRRMNRDDCIKWLNAHGYPIPEKSACVFCPYHSNATWKRLKTKHPQDFAHAVEFDTKLRNNHRSELVSIKGELFVHRSMKPLGEVSFDRADKRFQLELFGNECEGMCGV